MNLNKAYIIGNLTRDPETRSLPSGQSVVSFSVATNRTWTDQSGQKQTAVEYHNIVAFGKLADICSRYLSKGRLVLIEGRIQNRSWNSPDGQKRNRTEIVAENMQMGPRFNAEQNSNYKPQAQTKTATNLDQEEIPVIDADEISESPIIEEDENEIDVKNIPF